MNGVPPVYCISIRESCRENLELGASSGMSQVQASGIPRADSRSGLKSLVRGATSRVDMTSAETSRCVCLLRAPTLREVHTPPARRFAGSRRFGVTQVRGQASNLKSCKSTGLGEREAQGTPRIARGGGTGAVLASPLSENLPTSLGVQRSRSPAGANSPLGLTRQAAVATYALSTSQYSPKHQPPMLE